jgi:hypothetical protein
MEAEIDDKLPSNCTAPPSAKLQADISDAIFNGYMLNLEINSDWVSYRHPSLAGFVSRRK